MASDWQKKATPKVQFAVFSLQRSTATSHYDVWGNSLAESKANRSKK
jgi:hypothetical protein